MPETQNIPLAPTQNFMYQENSYFLKKTKIINEIPETEEVKIIETTTIDKENIPIDSQLSDSSLNSTDRLEIKRLSTTFEIPKTLKNLNQAKYINQKNSPKKLTKPSKKSLITSFFKPLAKK